jgi:hypothetical protein
VPYCTVVIDMPLFCVLNSVVSYGQSKRVIKADAFDRQWAFCSEPKFHSVVIVVPPHVSKSSRIPKKLTASPAGSVYCTV